MDKDKKDKGEEPKSGNERQIQEPIKYQQIPRSSQRDIYPRSISTRLTQDLWAQGVSVNAAVNSQTTNTTFTLIPGATATFTVVRPTIVSVFATYSNIYLIESAGNTGNGLFIISIVSGNQTTLLPGGATTVAVQINTGVDNGISASDHWVGKLSPGTYTAKLMFKVSVIAGAPAVFCGAFRLSYLIQGNN